MNADALPANPSPAEGEGGTPLAIDRSANDQANAGSGRRDWSGWLMLASALALLAAAGAFAFTAMHKPKPHAANLYAPVTVPLATADAQMAATRAKASAVAARHAAASVKAPAAPAGTGAPPPAAEPRSGEPAQGARN
jgi:flagellar basal body-associated protein FliL